MNTIEALKRLRTGQSTELIAPMTNARNAQRLLKTVGRYVLQYKLLGDTFWRDSSDGIPERDDWEEPEAKQHRPDLSKWPGVEGAYKAEFDGTKDLILVYHNYWGGREYIGSLIDGALIRLFTPNDSIDQIGLARLNEHAQAIENLRLWLKGKA